MALSGRAWAVTGSKTPANIARILAHAATSGGNGVVGTGHLQVTATPVPSGNVRINPGIVVMRSRYAGAFYETYIDRNDAAVDFPIAPTGSTGGRTDYLVARVEDPAFPGQVAPTDRVNGPYTRFATLTTDPRVSPPHYPFVLLAKVTIPANTGTIAQAMIDSGPSVREMANPRQKDVVLQYNGALPANTLTSKTGERWANSWSPTVEVPEWATQTIIEVRVDGILASGKGMAGEVWARIYKDANTTVTGAHGVWTVDDHADFAKVSRFSVGNVSRIYIPPSMRGGTHLVEIIGKRLDDNASSSVSVANGTSVSVRFTFLEAPVEDFN